MNRIDPKLLPEAPTEALKDATGPAWRNHYSVDDLIAIRGELKRREEAAPAALLAAQYDVLLDLTRAHNATRVAEDAVGQRHVEAAEHRVRQAIAQFEDARRSPSSSKPTPPREMFVPTKADDREASGEAEAERLKAELLAALSEGERLRARVDELERAEADASAELTGAHERIEALKASQAGLLSLMREIVGGRNGTTAPVKAALSRHASGMLKEMRAAIAKAEEGTR